MSFTPLSVSTAVSLPRDQRDTLSISEHNEICIALVIIARRIKERQANIQNEVTLPEQRSEIQ